MTAPDIIRIGDTVTLEFTSSASNVDYAFTRVAGIYGPSSQVGSSRTFTFTATEQMAISPPVIGVYFRRTGQFGAPDTYGLGIPGVYRIQVHPREFTSPELPEPTGLVAEDPPFTLLFGGDGQLPYIASMTEENPLIRTVVNIPYVKWEKKRPARA